MKQLLEDILYTLNQLPDRKVKGKDFTTYDLAKKIDKILNPQDNSCDIIDSKLKK